MEIESKLAHIHIYIYAEYCITQECNKHTNLSFVQGCTCGHVVKPVTIMYVSLLLHEYTYQAVNA